MKIFIDEVEYETDTMNEKQQAMVAELQFARGELTRLQFAATAAQTRSDVIIAELSKSLQEEPAEAEIVEESE